jgi:hypothetical protein
MKAANGRHSLSEKAEYKPSSSRRTPYRHCRAGLVTLTLNLASVKGVVPIFDYVALSFSPVFTRFDRLRRSLFGGL